jgi:YD repeat-containing protein
VLDSFKLLSEAEVAAAVKAKESAAEPSPLPQEPVAARDGSDASDNRLRGAVKTVFEESENLTGTSTVSGRKRSSMEYYNEGGNLTKREDYDYKGNLFQITVYGYIDGARVSSFKLIRHNYDPPPMAVVLPPGAASTKSDLRYSNKYTFRYDDQKRLIEKTWILNSGETTARHVYKYSGTQLETLFYSRDGSLRRRLVASVDDKGNKIEETEFETLDGPSKEKSSFAYEFDAKGNWVKRVTSNWVTKDGKSSFVPAYVHYRTITYY